MQTALAEAALRVTDPAAVLMLFMGTTLGVIFGALPGLGTITALAVVLPFTFGMDPMLAMFMYSGIISSGTFGGSVPAILLNTPGTPPNAATCLDGYPMTRRGEGARALAVSATACFVGSLGGAVILLALLPMVKPIVYAFGPPEFFWLVVFGLVTIAFAAKGNMVKGLVGGGLGILLSLIGYTEMYGVYRYTMDSEYLWDGIPMVPFVVGMLAVSELISYSASGGVTASAAAGTTGADWRRQTLQGIQDTFSRPLAVARATAIGAGIGVIPGVGAGVASFLSYVVAIQGSDKPETFGTGNLEGIIASETANDAKDGGSLLPTVAFGIPGSADMALLLGAFVLHGLQPGPLLLRDHMDLVYALLLGIVFSQILTSGLGLLSVPWLARLSTLPSRAIAPFVLVLVFVGMYMLRTSIFDVGLAVAAGVFGYCMRRYGFPLITVVIGFILGPLAEQAFLQSLMISDGRFDIFYGQPIVIVLMTLTLVTIALPVVKSLRLKATDKGAGAS